MQEKWLRRVLRVPTSVRYFTKSMKAVLTTCDIVMHIEPLDTATIREAQTYLEQ